MWDPKIKSQSPPQGVTVWWDGKQVHRNGYDKCHNGCVDRLLGTGKRKQCLYVGIVGENFPGEIMPEINLEQFAKWEGIQFSKV